jgi:ligand-binding sensor domain-containing protein
MMEDSNGNIWFATAGNGVCRYNGKEFSAFTENKGLTRNHVQSLLQTKNGIIFFGFSGGLFYLSGDSIVNIKKNGPWY